jgi:hypothetical protein
MYNLAFLVAAPILLVAIVLFYYGTKRTGVDALGGVSVMAWGFNIGILGIFVAAMIYLFA